MGAAIEWYAARIGDPVAMRVLMDGLRDEIRSARLTQRLPLGAQVYVVTEVDACQFLFNGEALIACPILERLGAPASGRPPHANERINPLIDANQ